MIAAGSQITRCSQRAAATRSITMRIVPEAVPAPDANYTSGNDYILEFLGCRVSVGATDFEGRVVAAAVKLGVVETSGLEDEEIDDLVNLAAQGGTDEPASPRGRYLVRNWGRVSLVEGESLVYWLRKLIFRGAWLDHQVKRGALEVVWDDGEAEVAYQPPGGGGPPLPPPRARGGAAPPCWSSPRCRGGTSCSSGRRYAVVAPAGGSRLSGRTPRAR